MHLGYGDVASMELIESVRQPFNPHQSGLPHEECRALALWKEQNESFLQS